MSEQALKIDKPITSVRVVQEQVDVKAVELMHENVERPDLLLGSTYKIKTPLSEHALYITINDIILNEGTEHEERRPYEVFINSKNMEHFQWVLALTRVISAVFRKGGDACFLVEELKGVFDPKGGYYKKGGVYSPSLVSEIGCAIEAHLIRIGMVKPDLSMKDAAMTMVNEKNALDLAKDAHLCEKCLVKAVVFLGGCKTCLSCGDSKCT